MHGLKRILFRAVTLLAVTGFCVAVANLPLLTGCDFYGRCTVPTHQSAQLDVPNDEIEKR